MKMAEHLLNQMISTGAEREKYDDYLFHLGSMLEAGHKEAYAESVEVSISEIEIDIIYFKIEFHFY